MAVLAGEDGVDEQLYAVHFGADGIDGRVHLTAGLPTVEVESPIWSPDGARLAFRTEDAATSEHTIYIADFTVDPVAVALLDVVPALRPTLWLDGWAGDGAVIVQDDVADPKLWWVDSSRPAEGLVDLTAHLDGLGFIELQLPERRSG